MILLIGDISGLTTMGSDRENPGAPNLNGPKFCKISPQSPGNGISESVDSKIFRMNMPWTP
jgi:hypothetical protein